MSDRFDAIRDAVRDAGIDGWLFYDFRRTNPIAHRVLGLDPHAMFSRRWFYYLPASGTPTALISAVEPHVLRELPGERHIFRTWNELHELLGKTLHSANRVAMEYSPDNAIPVVAKVDAGTVELVRRLGVEVVTSANLAQRFEAVLTPQRIESQREAGRRIITAKDTLFAWIREQMLAGATDLNEYTVQQHFVTLIEGQGLFTEHEPIIAINGHASDPHYAPSENESASFQRGDLLLIDFTGRLADQDDSVIADYTWMASLDDQVPERAANLFAIIREARDRGVAFIREHVEAGKPIIGAEVDDAVRAVIHDAGYGDYYAHRTGHNITTETHGSGANLDNFETHDDRLLLANTCCSMEPGIYLPDIGVRTEVNVLILDKTIEVTGTPAQTEILALLA